jgi:HK97 family phage major capsid protein
MSARLRNLQSQKAATVAAMRGITEAATAQDRDLSAEEQSAFDTHKTKIHTLNASIEREQLLAVEEAGLAAAIPSGHSSSAVSVAAHSTITVEDNADKDTRRGFASFGDYARAVMGASLATRNGSAMDRRLVPLAAAPSTFGGEGVGADGGVLVPPGFSSEIFRLSLGEDSLLPMTDDMQIDGNSMTIPKDETTPWGTNGIRAYWQGEAVSGTPTKPVLGAMSLRLKKLLALVPVSDELLSDTSALSSYLPAKVADSIRWKTNEAILFGAGAGVPLGALSGNAVVTVVKDAGQAANTLSATNLANMIARLPPGSFPRAVWLINNDVLPALFTLTLGNTPIYLPAGGPVGGIVSSPYGMLLGRPVMVSQHAKSFSSEGDVLLVDLSYYQAITKAEGVSTATSMHLFFDADAMAFRTTFRMDGQPKIATAISPANGSNSLSPFVKLGAR